MRTTLEWTGHCHRHLSPFATARLPSHRLQRLPNVCAELLPFGEQIKRPDQLDGAIRAGPENTSTPTVIDVMVTRGPAKMLPAVDSRTPVVKKGDRPV